MNKIQNLEIYFCNSLKEYNNSYKNSNSIYIVKESENIIIFLGKEMVSNTKTLVTIVNLIENYYKNSQWDFLQNLNQFDGAKENKYSNSGLVPISTPNDINKFLCGDGTWKTPEQLNITPKLEWEEI